ncbi:SRPBCC family protein [candidate division KSB1 bacterium]|nr:SRPBCC family protein [candidate division KSB1 bacterium]
MSDMTRFTATRSINAPIDLVFKTVSDINNFSKAIPDIINVEFLSDVKSGIGTRFRETRLMNGKEAMTELEVTEFVENDHVRMVTDSHGAVWDSVFTVKRVDGHTELTLVMDARPHKFMQKMMIPMIKGMISKALEKDMDAVKTYCEK